MGWRESVKRSDEDKWRNDRNQWRNGEWTWGENITIRQIDLSVMNDGNGFVGDLSQSCPGRLQAILWEVQRQWIMVMLIDSGGRQQKDNLHFHYNRDRLLSPECFDTRADADVHILKHANTWCWASAESQPQHLCSVWVTVYSKYRGFVWVWDLETAGKESLIK